jgi:hypothetical protein
MRTEKLCLSGHVTVECLNDVVGGPATIISYFEDSMRRWAHNHNWFLMTEPKVIVSLPDYDSWWSHKKFVQITVIARAVRVTPIPGEFTCWSEC